MIGLTLILSPYLLTVLLALVLAVGIPRLPAPLRRMLPAPIVEVPNTPVPLPTTKSAGKHIASR